MKETEKLVNFRENSTIGFFKTWKIYHQLVYCFGHTKKAKLYAMKILYQYYPWVFFKNQSYKLKAQYYQLLNLLDDFVPTSKSQTTTFYGFHYHTTLFDPLIA